MKKLILMAIILFCGVSAFSDTYVKENDNYIFLAYKTYDEFRCDFHRYFRENIVCPTNMTEYTIAGDIASELSFARYTGTLDFFGYTEDYSGFFEDFNTIIVYDKTVTDKYSIVMFVVNKQKEVWTYSRYFAKQSVGFVE